MSGDDYVALSPSTHTVPCSPFLRTYNRDSPAPCVPDIDRLIGRRLHYNSNQEYFGGRISPLRSSQLSQSSQNEPQQIPATPIPNRSQDVAQKKISLEQVVPSCSPFITFDDEKSQNSQQSQSSQPQQQNGSQEVIENKDPKHINIKKKVIPLRIPCDEKPAINNNDIQDQLLGPKPPKRQPRTMENRSSLKVDFLKSDDIFG